MLASILDQARLENVRFKKGETQRVGREERMLPPAIRDDFMRANVNTWKSYAHVLLAQLILVAPETAEVEP